MCKEFLSTHLIHPCLPCAAQGIPYACLALSSIIWECNSQSAVFKPSPLCLTLQQKPFIEVQKMVLMVLKGGVYFQM